VSDSPSNLLLAESKSLSKPEAEPYAQLYGRIGFFVTVFAIYANALV
jgi:hypothetical protein